MIAGMLSYRVSVLSPKITNNNFYAAPVSNYF